VRFASCSIGDRRFAGLVDGDVVRPLRDVAALGADTPAELLADPPYRTHQWLPGKNWAASTPLGPFLVTPDEVGDPHALDISLELNGQRMQSGNTRQFIFDIPAIVAAISEFVPLAPGDVVLTGTPSGVGYRRDPQVLLRDGDRVVVEIERVGRLENAVAAERA
jgi:acylpyruvate hydrolase